MHPLSLLSKKGTSLRPVEVTAKAHNRTGIFLFFNTKTQEFVVKFPGEACEFIRKIKGNWNSLFAARSQWPDRDLKVYTKNGNTHPDKFVWVLIAKNKTKL